MFTCCLCGKKYNTSNEAVQCVNRCGRECQRNGKFSVKESVYREGKKTVSFLHQYSSTETLENIFNEVKEIAPEPEFKNFKISILKGWDALSLLEKENRIKSAAMVRDLMYANKMFKN
jgi:hypothetical protein